MDQREFSKAMAIAKTGGRPQCITPLEWRVNKTPERLMRLVQLRKAQSEKQHAGA